MIPKLITAKDLSQRYSTHVKTIYKWTYKKILPVVKISANCVRYDTEECDEALKRRTRKSRLLARLTTSLLFAVSLQSGLAKTATPVQQELHTIDGQSFAMRRSGVRIPYSPRSLSRFKSLLVSFFQAILRNGEVQPEGALW